MCFITAGNDISNGSAIVLTAISVVSLSAARIARRVGSASAEKVRSRGSD